MGLVVDTSALVVVERSAAGWEGMVSAIADETAVLPAIVYGELLVGVHHRKGRLIPANDLAVAATALHGDPDQRRRKEQPRSGAQAGGFLDIEHMALTSGEPFSATKRLMSALVSR